MGVILSCDEQGCGMLECWGLNIKWQTQPSQYILTNYLSSGLISNQDQTQSIKRVKSQTDMSECSQQQKHKVQQYRIIKYLGEGSFGKVYLVKDKVTFNCYAMKKLNKNKLENANIIENEVSILQKVDHPNIVRMHDSFEYKSHVYLILEYMKGGELSTRLEQNTKLDIQTVRVYSAQIINAFQYLHNNLGIIYRDLKPENVMFDKQDKLKLIDFGLSQQNDKLDFTFEGTPNYLAPEVIRQRKYNELADYWSLGCLMYQMMIGRPPFMADTKHQLYDQIINEDPWFPQDIDHGFKDLISQLLNKSSTCRPNIR